MHVGFKLLADPLTLLLPPQRPPGTHPHTTGKGAIQSVRDWPLWFLYFHTTIYLAILPNNHHIHPLLCIDIRGALLSCWYLDLLFDWINFHSFHTFCPAFYSTLMVLAFMFLQVLLCFERLITLITVIFLSFFSSLSGNTYLLAQLRVIGILVLCVDMFL